MIIIVFTGGLNNSIKNYFTLIFTNYLKSISFTMTLPLSITAASVKRLNETLKYHRRIIRDGEIFFIYLVTRVQSAALDSQIAWNCISHSWHSDIIVCLFFCWLANLEGENDA